MIKKYQIGHLVAVMIATMFSVCFVSCDNDDGGSEKVTIVGTWVDGSKTMTLGSDGSYNLKDTSVPDIPQYRKGTYSYNANQGMMTIHVIAVAGQNSAYQHTYIVQTLTSTALVLLDIDGDVEGCYTRK